MNAEIITYETKNMSNSKRSIISKKIFGYVDRTKSSQYAYKREGLIESIPHIMITKKTFIISSTDAVMIKKIIEAYGAIVKSWKIQISKVEMRNNYG